MVLKKLISAILILSSLSMMSQTVYDFKVLDRKGGEVSLASYKGKVLLIVNTATRCGFTPQYEELEALYKNYKEQGLEILDFPCNQFGQQAPGTEEEIHSFCQLNYGTEFPQFKKIDVNGENAAPLFTYLKAQKGFEGFDLNNKIGALLDDMLSKADPNYKQNPDIKWNFTKFLIDQQGNVVARFEPTAPMADVEAQVKELFAAVQDAPSWANQQPSKYYVAMSEEKLKAVQNLVGQNKERIANAPVLIVSTFERGKSGFHGDEPVNEVGDGWGAYDNGLSNCYLIMKARAMGFDTLIMGMRDADPLRELFAIPSNESVMAVIALGYRADEPKRPQHRGLDEILKIY